MHETDQRLMIPDIAMDMIINKRRRQTQPTPDEAKDDAYWERRRRNNESARKSRECRRQRETATSSRVNTLEHENVRLRAELETLREEISHLRGVLYGTAKRECLHCTHKGSNGINCNGINGVNGVNGQS